MQDSGTQFEEIKGGEQNQQNKNSRVKKFPLQLSGDGNSRVQNLTPPRLLICTSQNLCDRTDSNLYIEADVVAFKARGVGEHHLCRSFIVYCKLLGGNKAQPIAVAWRREIKSEAQIRGDRDYRLDCRMPWNDGNQHQQGPLHGRFTHQEIEYWFALVGYKKPAQQVQQVEIYSQDGQDMGMLAMHWFRNAYNYAPSHKCDICDKMFVNNVALFLHRFEKHSVPLPQPSDNNLQVDKIVQLFSKTTQSQIINSYFNEFGNSGTKNISSTQQLELPEKQDIDQKLDAQLQLYKKSNNKLDFSSNQISSAVVPQSIQSTPQFFVQGSSNNFSVFNPTPLRLNPEVQQMPTFLSSKSQSDPQHHRTQNNEGDNDIMGQQQIFQDNNFVKRAAVEDLSEQNDLSKKPVKRTLVEDHSQQKSSKKRVKRGVSRKLPCQQQQLQQSGGKRIEVQSRQSDGDQVDQMQIIELAKAKIRVAEDVCWFCMEGEHLNSIRGLGDLLESRKYVKGRNAGERPRKMKFHYCCAMFAAGGDPVESVDPLTFKEEELAKRWLDSAPNECCQCGKKFASVACFKGKSCRERHHFPCLRRVCAVTGEVNFSTLSYDSCCTMEQHEQQFQQEFNAGKSVEEFQGMWFENWYYPGEGTEEQRQEAQKSGRHLQEAIPPGGRWAI